MIMLMGYWAVKNTVQKACQVEQVTFKTELERMITKGTSFGSISNQILKAPCGYTTLCIVDSRRAGATPIPNPPTAAYCSLTSIISATRFGKDNIFLHNGAKISPVMSSELISVTNPNACPCFTARNGNFYITFKGDGVNTQINATTT